MQIERYSEEHTMQLIRIYHDTIHNVNKVDYTPEELEAWAPSDEVTKESYQKDVNRWKKINPFVVTDDDLVLGFAELEEKGHINCFFVHHLHQGKGVGSMLIDACIDEGKILGYDKIFAEVSITAKPFFLSKGFIYIRPEISKINGVDIKYFVMEMQLDEK